ncbi:Fosmidomycin resistance protein [bioreactor metagenome]|uniref:Fosmidomycin resistance protein n=1 Tax=bioreactor metagenome TaxID=1076179 RepID=A0A644V5E1_9ZZZZ|nr:MFS transporter [Methanocorpusculum sp.]
MNELTKRIAGLAAGHGAADFYIPVIPAILPALIPIFTEQGITSYAMAGCLFTLVTLTMVIFQPLTGWMIDKGRWVPGISWCILMTGLAVALFGITQNYWVLLIMAVVTGAGNSMFHPNAYQQIHQFTTSANRGTFLSLFSVGGSFGYGAAPLITGALFAWGGFPALIWLVLPAVGVAVLLRKHQQKPVILPKKTSETKSVQPKWRHAALVLGISSLRTWVYYGFLAFAAVYLTKYAGVDYLLATGVVSCMIFAGMFGTLTAGPLSDKIGRKEVMFAAYIGAVTAYFGIFLLSGIGSVISLVIAGFFMMATASVEIATVQELMPGSVGLASGIMIGIPQGLAAVSIMVIGIMADTVGMPTALFTQVWLMVAAVILCAALPYPLKLLSPSRRKAE